MGGAGTGAKLPPELYPIPNINTPTDIIQYPPEFRTGPDGHGELPITASPEGPGNPRGYVDGQLYGINYQIKESPPGYVFNPLNYISVLAWNRYDVPDIPTWFDHVQPILEQYGDLYPIMSRRLVNLADYDSVVANAGIIKFSFSLPLHDPNSMPASRDLSLNKRRTLLKWLDTPDPLTGLPVRGVEPAAPPTAVASIADEGETAGLRPDDGGKYAELIHRKPRENA